METVTGTSNFTRYFEDGQQVFPCHCGETHRGDYALEAWTHHNCEHGPMSQVAGNVMCLECGATFPFKPCECD